MDVEEKVEDLIFNDDLLNRQPFIEQVIKIIELQADQRKTSCFAINGKWGVGKSFVLERLEKQLEIIQSEETKSDKYLIFHYNCWQYDYYDEPLVAMVSSMLDTIDEKENLIPSDAKAKIKGFLKAVGSALLVKANEAIEKKTGFNPQEIIDVITDATERSAEKIEEEHRYDSNFIFKATLKRLQETIRDLANDKTIIFVVDELDRCLPEYAIKILERLHHVFAGIPNVQVILSIDKSQLEHIIKKTFGENTETQKYLSKFINFEVNLDEGTFSDKTEFDNKFIYYLQNFEYSNKNTDPYEVDEFRSRIFDEIDMRSRIEIIEKCNLLHRLLNKDDEIQDFSIMCIEISLVLFHYFGLDKKEPQISKTNMFENAESVSKGIGYLNQKYQEEQNSGLLLWAKTGSRFEFRSDNIIALVFEAYRITLGFNKDICNNQYDQYNFSEIKIYINKFNDLLNTIN